MFARVAARARWALGWRARERERHARWDGYQVELARQATELARQAESLEALSAELAGLRKGLGGPSLDRLLAAEARLDDVARVRSLAEDALAGAKHATARGNDAFDIASFATDTAREALLPARVAVFGAWLELNPPPPGALLSVILPTRDRPSFLPRALTSVLLQRYPRWQLLVVDDGETDAVAATLASLDKGDDERILVVEGPRRGLAAARNAGLEQAEGEVVCYLDDDNVMHPGWLQAIAHVFTARADVEVAYGVTLAEHRLPDSLEPEAWWPSLWQLPASRETLLGQNPADAGALAHRRELDGARFDESLSGGEDWDLLVRLTSEREALAVPAISHGYRRDGEDRMSRDPEYRAGLDQLRRRHAGGGGQEPGGPP